MKVRRYRGTSRPPGIHPDMWNKVLTAKERKLLAAEYEEKLRREREGAAGQPDGRPGSSADAAPAATAAAGKPAGARQQIVPSVLELCANHNSEFGKTAERFGITCTRVTELDNVESNEGVSKALRVAQNFGALCIISLSSIGGSDRQKANFLTLLRGANVVADAIMNNGGT